MMPHSAALRRPAETIAFRTINAALAPFYLASVIVV
jgi:hypothetical protein